jgi:hypothetical protein
MLLQKTHAIASCSSESVQQQKVHRWRAILRRHDDIKKKQVTTKLARAARATAGIFLFFFPQPYEACLRLSQWRSLSV